MELYLKRIEFSRDGCIGKLYRLDEYLCDTLEDKDRDLKQSWELASILAFKVPGETAIPYGRYEIDITYSKRFKKPLPILLNVMGFEGVRLHSGNTKEDTSACILVGDRSDNDEIMIVNSRKRFAEVFKIIGEALLNERVFITIAK